MDEMPQANESQNHEQLFVEHIRGQAASLKVIERNAYTAFSYRDTELHAELQVYQMELAAEKVEKFTVHIYISRRR